MKYWVNEDKITSRATVHKDSCPHGVNHPKKPADGRWHGPFFLKRRADARAEDTGCRDVGDCATCFP